jgi:AraC-like DNA-binding protein
LFEEAQRLMRENLARSLSVANIAARLGVSAAFFSARFKAESGMTPGDYLRRLRCERACELLADTRLTVTETAFRLGFSTSQHFAGVFRRYVGVSPRQFRRGA